jgi:WD40 repeat protein
MVTSSSQIPLNRHYHKNTVQALAWSPNGNFVASASRDQTLRVFDIRAMKELQALRGHKKEVCCKSYITLTAQKLTKDSCGMASLPSHPCLWRIRGCNPTLGSLIFPCSIDIDNQFHRPIDYAFSTCNPLASTRVQRLGTRIPLPRASPRIRLQRSHHPFLVSRTTGRFIQRVLGWRRKTAGRQ